MCRTLTSTLRLLESLDFLRGDFRLTLRFTIDDRTRFGAGVRRLLVRSGVTDILPWDQVASTHFTLALAASENIDPVTMAGRPVLVLPHGIGFNKYIHERGTVRIAGLPPDNALRTGQVTVVLSHPEQDAQLRRVAPAIAGHTVVTGDTVLDQLDAGVAHRTRYRRQLGVGDRHLVLVSSTWNPDSSLGRHRTLLHRLLAELPADDYAVASTLHPNVWAEYGELGLRVLFADPLDAGLLLLPPATGWQGALIAADTLIADHSSLALHGAAAGKPLLLSAPSAETVPGTPVEALAELAPRLDPSRDLIVQLGQGALDLSAVTGRAFAYRGEAVRRLRELIYEKLGLEPEGPAVVRRPPDIHLHREPVTAFRVHGELTGDLVTLSRYPAATRPEKSGHLVVDERETSLRLLQKAAALTCSDQCTPEEARAWTTSILDSYPGARIAVARTTDSCILLIRGSTHFLAQNWTDPLVLASAAYIRFLKGEYRDGRVRLGNRTTELTLRVLPAAP